LLDIDVCPVDDWYWQHGKQNIGTDVDNRITVRRQIPGGCDQAAVFDLQQSNLLVRFE
jgi:hypothetical protein